MKNEDENLPDRANVRSALRAALRDSDAQQSRRALGGALEGGFADLGPKLREMGNIFGQDRVEQTSPFGNGSDWVVALGYVCELAASLISGAMLLIEAENAYGAAALTRQLVEVEYVSWAFAEDHAEAAAWLRSNRDERLQRWQPRHLRQRSEGRFRGEDYGTHCEMGGHPTPEGARVLIGGGVQVGEVVLQEVVMHGLSTWRYLCLAVETSSHDDGGTWAALIDPNLNRSITECEAALKSVDEFSTIWRQIQSGDQ